MTTEVLGNTNDPELGTARDGTLVCRQCGARHRMTDEEVRTADLRRGLAFAAAHGSRCDGSTSTPEVEEAHLKVMRNLARGARFEEGFLVQQKAMQAMFQCVLRGWVDLNQLTNAGRALLASHELHRSPPDAREVARVALDVRVVPDPEATATADIERAPILLPPSSLDSRGRGE